MGKILHKILSVITARKGSKGLPGKNHRLLYGVPLVAWSIFHSIRCRDIGLTVVSSNCEHVKHVVSTIQSEMLLPGQYMDSKYSNIFNFSNPDFGQLKFIQRPEKFATNTSPNEEALIHAYRIAKSELGFEADIIINLQPTSPIRGQNLLHDCIHKFLESGADSLFTVSIHTPFFVHKDGHNNIVNERSKLFDRPMRQSLQEKDFFLHDCGNIYITSRESLLSTNNRIGKNFVVIPVTVLESMQIDTILDFQIIDFLFQEGLIE